MKSAFFLPNAAFAMAVLDLISRLLLAKFVGRDSSVGTATRYGLDGPGIESRWGGVRFSAPVQTGPGGPPSLLYNGYQVFHGGKGGRGVTLTTHPI